MGLSLLTACGSSTRQAHQPTVVFVCEHGAAKSVIAAAWFNKLASERHLPFHAIARGTTPQESFSASAVTGLQKDGVPFAQNKPARLTADVARDAVRVVAFCPLPDSIKPRRLNSFTVPSPGNGYDESRDAIVGHVKALLDELEKAGASK